MNMKKTPISLFLLVSLFVFGTGSAFALQPCKIVRTSDQAMVYLFQDKDTTLGRFDRTAFLNAFRSAQASNGRGGEEHDLVALNTFIQAALSASQDKCSVDWSELQEKIGVGHLSQLDHHLQAQAADRREIAEEKEAHKTAYGDAVIRCNDSNATNRRIFNFPEFFSKIGQER